MKFGLALLMLVAALPAVAQTRGEDLAHGRAVAEAWCANCHVVAPGARSGGDAAPSFASIARRNPDPDGLRTWLSQRHRNLMPRYDLTRAEVNDVIAYMLSLQR